MAVPQPTFGPNGFVSPAEPDILIAVKGEVNAAFGNVLNMADETPQGQLSVSMTAAIGNANDLFTLLTQQFDPAYNFGRYQDAIARIYFIERIPATSTIVSVTCLGLPGVVIPQGALALSSDGNRYQAISGGVIGAGGSVDLEFQCVTLGPIPCSAGTITTIYQAVNGWDSVSNSAAGVTGRATETRDAFEQRRAMSVAHNSQGSLPSILGAVLTTAGVVDAFVTENVNQTAISIRGTVINPNSIYVAAVGGTDADVAAALWSKKSPGCGYTGNTAVVVQDTSSVYVPPYPSYTVLFQRPSFATVTFVVSIANSSLVPANAVSLIQAAIVSAFEGQDGGPMVRIGATILASRFYAAVAALGVWAQVVTIKLGCSNAPAAVFNGSIAGSALTVSSVSSGSLAVGQQLVGNGILSGTTIQSGGGTSWVVSNVQTVSLGQITSVSAASDEILIGIDQSPVTALGNTAVVLA